MNCWQREYVLRPEDDQILRLTPSFSWSGCHVVGSDSPDVGDLFVCKGGRSFSVYADRLTTWYIAVSNCATLTGIELRYRLEVRSIRCSIKSELSHYAYVLYLYRDVIYIYIFIRSKEQLARKQTIRCNNKQTLTKQTGTKRILAQLWSWYHITTCYLRVTTKKSVLHNFFRSQILWTWLPYWQKIIFTRQFLLSFKNKSDVTALEFLKKFGCTTNIYLVSDW